MVEDVPPDDDLELTEPLSSSRLAKQRTFLERSFDRASTSSTASAALNTGARARRTHLAIESAESDHVDVVRLQRVHSGQTPLRATTPATMAGGSLGGASMGTDTSAGSGRKASASPRGAKFVSLEEYAEMERRSLRRATGGGAA